MNFPVVATLITSLKSDAEISANPSLMIQHPTLVNYRMIFAMQDRFDIVQFLFNSLVASLIGASLSIALAFPAAYAVVRTGVGRRWLMAVAGNLGALPLIVFSIPIYLMYQQLSLLDTRLGLGLILALVNVPLAVVLFVTAIRELPLEVEESARIDGADTVRTLLYVVAPMALSIVAATSVLSFIYSWNEFLFGLMLTTTRATPVTVGASFFFSASGGGIKWGVAAAVMMLATLPPLVLGLAMYRQIGRTMTAGAVKG